MNDNYKGYKGVSKKDERKFYQNNTKPEGLNDAQLTQAFLDTKFYQRFKDDPNFDKLSQESPEFRRSYWNAHYDDPISKQDKNPNVAPDKVQQSTQAVSTGAGLEQRQQEFDKLNQTTPTIKDTANTMRDSLLTPSTDSSMLKETTLTTPQQAMKIAADRVENYPEQSRTKADDRLLYQQELVNVFNQVENEVRQGLADYYKKNTGLFTKIAYMGSAFDKQVDNFTKQVLKYPDLIKGKDNRLYKAIMNLREYDKMFNGEAPVNEELQDDNSRLNKDIALPKDVRESKPNLKFNPITKTLEPITPYRGIDKMEAGVIRQRKSEEAKRQAEIKAENERIYNERYQQVYEAEMRFHAHEDDQIAAISRARKTAEKAANEAVFLNQSVALEDNPLRSIDTPEKLIDALSSVSDIARNYLGTSLLPMDEVMEMAPELFNTLKADIGANKLNSAKRKIDIALEDIVGNHQPFFISNDDIKSKSRVMLETIFTGMVEGAGQMVMTPINMGRSVIRETFLPNITDNSEQGVSWVNRVWDGVVNEDNMIALHGWASNKMGNNDQVYGRDLASYVAKGGYTYGILIPNIVIPTANMFFGPMNVAKGLTTRGFQSQMFKNVSKEIKAGTKQAGKPLYKMTSDEKVELLSKVLPDASHDDIIKTVAEIEHKAESLAAKVIYTSSIVEMSTNEAMIEGLDVRQSVLEDMETKKQNTINNIAIRNHDNLSTVSFEQLMNDKSFVFDRNRAMELYNSAINAYQGYDKIYDTISAQVLNDLNNQLTKSIEEANVPRQSLSDDEINAHINKYYSEHGPEINQLIMDRQKQFVENIAKESIYKAMAEDEFNSKAVGYDEMAVKAANAANRATTVAEGVTISAFELLGGGLVSKTPAMKKLKSIYDQSARKTLRVEGEAGKMTFKGLSSQDVTHALKQPLGTVANEVGTEVLQGIESDLGKQWGVLTAEEYMNGIYEGDGQDEAGQLAWNALKSLDVDEALFNANIPEVIKSTAVAVLAFSGLSPVMTSAVIPVEKTMNGRWYDKVWDVAYNFMLENPVMDAANELIQEQRRGKTTVALMNKFYNDPNNQEVLDGVFGLSHWSNKAIDGVAANDLGKYEDAQLASAFSEAVMLSSASHTPYLQAKYDQIKNIAEHASDQELHDMWQTEATNNLYANMSEAEASEVLRGNAKRLLQMIDRIQQEQKLLDQEYGVELPYESRVMMIFNKIMSEDIAKRRQEKLDIINSVDTEDDTAVSNITSDNVISAYNTSVSKGELNGKEIENSALYKYFNKDIEITNDDGTTHTEPKTLSMKDILSSNMPIGLRIFMLDKDNSKYFNNAQNKILNTLRDKLSNKKAEYHGEEVPMIEILHSIAHDETARLVMTIEANQLTHLPKEVANRVKDKKRKNEHKRSSKLLDRIFGTYQKRMEKELSKVANVSSMRTVIDKLQRIKESAGSILSEEDVNHLIDNIAEKHPEIKAIYEEKLAIDTAVNAAMSLIDSSQLNDTQKSIARNTIEERTNTANSLQEFIEDDVMLEQSEDTGMLSQSESLLLITEIKDILFEANKVAVGAVKPITVIEEDNQSQTPEPTKTEEQFGISKTKPVNSNPKARVHKHRSDKRSTGKDIDEALYGDMTDEMYKQITESFVDAQRKSEAYHHFEHPIYRGTGDVTIDEDGNLILIPSYDMNKNVGVSLTILTDVAHAYGHRHGSLYFVIEFDEDYLEKIVPLIDIETTPNWRDKRDIRYSEGSEGEYRIVSDHNIKIPKEHYILNTIDAYGILNKTTGALISEYNQGVTRMEQDEQGLISEGRDERHTSGSDMKIVLSLIRKKLQDVYYKGIDVADYMIAAEGIASDNPFANWEYLQSLLDYGFLIKQDNSNYYELSPLYTDILKGKYNDKDKVEEHNRLKRTVDFTNIIPDALVYGESLYHDGLLGLKNIYFHDELSRKCTIALFNYFLRRDETTKFKDIKTNILKQIGVNIKDNDAVSDINYDGIFDYMYFHFRYYEDYINKIIDDIISGKVDPNNLQSSIDEKTLLKDVSIKSERIRRYIKMLHKNEAEVDFDNQEQVIERLNLIQRIHTANEKLNNALSKEDVEYIDKETQRIKDNGYELNNLVGENYVKDMPVKVTKFVEDTRLPEGTYIISGVNKHQVKRNGKVIQFAEVVVRQHPVHEPEPTITIDDIESQEVPVHLKDLPKTVNVEVSLVPNAQGMLEQHFHVKLADDKTPLVNIIREVDDNGNPKERFQVTCLNSDVVNFHDAKYNDIFVAIRRMLPEDTIIYNGTASINDENLVRRICSQQLEIDSYIFVQDSIGDPKKAIMYYIRHDEYMDDTLEDFNISYNDIISDFAKVEQERQGLPELSSEDFAWMQAKSKDNVSYYLGFCKKFPNDNRVNEAQKRIRELLASKDYASFEMFGYRFYTSYSDQRYIDDNGVIKNAADVINGWDEKNIMQVNKQIMKLSSKLVHEYYEEKLKNDTTPTNDTEELKRRAEARGDFMKAPNGQPTKLTESQWLQVRTKAFKEWFGDWEKDPANASKVVDENGEPLVVYHASNKSFDEFKENDGIHFGSYLTAIGLAEEKGWINTPDEIIGNEQAMREYVEKKSNLNVYPVFLNVKNLEESKDLGTNWGVIKENNKDGAHYMAEEGDSSYVVFTPNQIKSATDNSGKFDANSNNIYDKDDSQEQQPTPEPKPEPKIDKEWEQATRINTLDAYISYTNNNPKGEYIKNAREKIKNIIAKYPVIIVKNKPNLIDPTNGKIYIDNIKRDPNNPKATIHNYQEATDLTKRQRQLRYNRANVSSKNFKFIEPPKEQINVHEYLKNKTIDDIISKKIRGIVVSMFQDFYKHAKDVKLDLNLINSTHSLWDKKKKYFPIVKAIFNTKQDYDDYIKKFFDKNVVDKPQVIEELFIKQYQDLNPDFIKSIYNVIDTYLTDEQLKKDLNIQVDENQIATTVDDIVLINLHQMFSGNSPYRLSTKGDKTIKDFGKFATDKDPDNKYILSLDKLKEMLQRTITNPNNQLPVDIGDLSTHVDSLIEDAISDLNLSDIDRKYKELEDKYLEDFRSTHEVFEYTEVIDAIVNNTRKFSTMDETLAKIEKLENNTNLPEDFFFEITEPPFNEEELQKIVEQEMQEYQERASKYEIKQSYKYPIEELKSIIEDKISSINGEYLVIKNIIGNEAKTLLRQAYYAIYGIETLSSDIIQKLERFRLIQDNGMLSDNTHAYIFGDKFKRLFEIHHKAEDIVKIVIVPIYSKTKGTFIQYAYPVYKNDANAEDIDKYYSVPLNGGFVRIDQATIYTKDEYVDLLKKSNDDGIYLSLNELAQYDNQLKLTDDNKALREKENNKSQPQASSKPYNTASLDAKNKINDKISSSLQEVANFKQSTKAPLILDVNDNSPITDANATYSDDIIKMKERRAALQLLHDAGGFDYVNSGRLKVGDKFKILVSREKINDKTRIVYWIVTSEKIDGANNNNAEFNAKFHGHQVLNAIDHTNVLPGTYLDTELKKAYNEFFEQHKDLEQDATLVTSTEYTVDEISGDYVPIDKSFEGSNIDRITSHNLNQILDKDGTNRFGYNTPDGFVPAIINLRKQNDDVLMLSNLDEGIKKKTKKSYSINISSGEITLLVATRTGFDAVLPIVVLTGNMENAHDKYKQSIANGAIGNTLKNRIFNHMNQMSQQSFGRTRFSDYFTMTVNNNFVSESIQYDYQNDVFTFGYKLNKVITPLFTVKKGQSQDTYKIQYPGQEPIQISFSEMVERYFDDLMNIPNINFTLYLQQSLMLDPKTNGIFNAVLQDMIADGMLWAPHAIPGRLHSEGSHFSHNNPQNKNNVTINPTIQQQSNIPPLVNSVVGETEMSSPDHVQVDSKINVVVSEKEAKGYDNMITPKMTLHNLPTHKTVTRHDNATTNTNNAKQQQFENVGSKLYDLTYSEAVKSYPEKMEGITESKFAELKKDRRVFNSIFNCK